MNTKPPARVITIAWGAYYIDELLSLTLPALLAPGNLPEVAAAFSCEFVLVTEERFFARIESTPIFSRLRTLCQTRLVPIDDLLAHGGSYGLSLTYAFHRGFADLGERMTDYYLFFFNADFILADGCYRSVVAKLNAGERLVLAPSYCVNAEHVKPILLSRRHPADLTLSLRFREMAALALENRHNTVKGKTVNQSLCHLEWIEQFYWNVDEHTLLGHQLPISIVCLRPERVYVEPVTFWDYGLLSEICPNIKPCVLDNSDDFLMIELRRMSTAEEHLLPGWPSVHDIASQLALFSTKDQRDHGLHQLVLHDEDLSPQAAVASVRLREYVESVLRALPPPVDHRNHAQWIYHYRHVSQYIYGRSIAEQLLGFDKAASKSTNIDPRELEQVKVRHNCHVESMQTLSWKGRVFTAIFGVHPRLTRNHGYWADFRFVVEAINRIRMEQPSRLLVITGEQKVATDFLDEVPGLHVSVPLHIVKKNSLHRIDEQIAGEPKALRSSPPGSAGIERKAFDVCFCDVDFETLIRFREPLANIRNVMKSGGRVIIFYANSTYRPMSQKELSLLLSSTLPFGSPSISIATLPSPLVIRIARKLVRVAKGWLARGGAKSKIIHGLIMLLSAPFARLANSRTQDVQKLAVPRLWTSVTVEIDIR